jgi:crossover junction endodeoxyribonuclease RuvC
MTTWVLGIDPGTSGAFALLNPAGAIIRLAKVPLLEEIKKTIDKKTGKAKQAKRSRLNLFELKRELQSIITLVSAHDQRLVVYLEQVGANPTDGALGAFAFGRGFGHWEGLLTALDLPIMLAHPTAWKAVMVPLKIKSPKLSKDASKTEKGRARRARGKVKKDAAKNRAMQLFPANSLKFAGKEDDGPAEAALLAEYGRRIENMQKVEKSPKVEVDLTPPPPPV